MRRHIFVVVVLFATANAFTFVPRHNTPVHTTPLLASSLPTPSDPLNPSKVGRLVEVSFVKACMQLSTGYVDVLKLFIASVKAGYELDLTIPQLNLEIANCGVATAGRPLAADEIELRSVWISLTYLTLELVHHRPDCTLGESVPPEYRQKFNTFVYDVVNAHKSGFTLQSLKLEELMRRDADSPPLEMIEEAIMSQSMRLVFLTLEVLKEEEEASGNGNGNTPPRPPIPGA